MKQRFKKVIEYQKEGILPHNKSGIADMFLTWGTIIIIIFIFPICYFFYMRNVHYEKEKVK